MIDQFERKYKNIKYSSILAAGFLIGLATDISLNKLSTAKSDLLNTKKTIVSSKTLFITNGDTIYNKIDAPAHIVPDSLLAKIPNF